MMSIFMAAVLVLMLYVMKMEKGWREETFQSQVAASFIHPDGHISRMLSHEVIIGTAKNADMRVYLPRIRKGAFGFIPYKVDKMHIFVEKKRDAFLIRNISEEYPVELKLGNARKFLKYDEVCELPHECEISLGGYIIKFRKGRV